jgi:hypothetical protein
VSAEKEYRASGGQCFIDGQWRYLVDKDKADAFISELQARNEVQRVHLEKLLAELAALRAQYDACQKTCLQRDALIDELDEMKGRRCETCKHTPEDLCSCEVVWVPLGETPEYHRITACNRWSARKDGES